MALLSSVWVHESVCVEVGDKALGPTQLAGGVHGCMRMCVGVHVRIYVTRVCMCKCGCAHVCQRVHMRLLFSLVRSYTGFSLQTLKTESNRNPVWVLWREWEAWPLRLGSSTGRHALFGAAPSTPCWVASLRHMCAPFSEDS